jgi:hypothetical protein
MAPLSSYGYLGRDRQRNRGFFSDLVRGVSSPREGSKILSFLYRPRLVCSSLLHLRSSWKVNSADFAITEFYEVVHRAVPMRQGFLCRVQGNLGASYIRSHKISGKSYGSLVSQAHRTGPMQPLRS